MQSQFILSGQAKGVGLNSIYINVMGPRGMQLQDVLELSYMFLLCKSFNTVEVSFVLSWYSH